MNEDSDIVITRPIAIEELILAAKVLTINLCFVKRRKTRAERRLINAAVQLVQIDGGTTDFAKDRTP